MKKFLDFHERFVNFLSSKMGAAQTSLAYVLRPKDQMEVTDDDRLGTVGRGKSHTYETWADYATRCTILEGKHSETDNARVWQILSSLIGTGPGSTYLKSENQDGQKDFLLMMNMAYEDSNVAQLVEDEVLWMNSCTYSGDSKFYDFKKHKSKWFDCKCPREAQSNA